MQTRNAETRIRKAMEKFRPVTITYVREDGTETVRTIEPYDVFTSKKGDTLFRAMDRETGLVRSWRVDRIVSYTVHRGRFLVERTLAAAA